MQEVRDEADCSANFINLYIFDIGKLLHVTDMLLFMLP
jgi:hypothetical protein